MDITYYCTFNNFTNWSPFSAYYVVPPNSSVQVFPKVLAGEELIGGGKLFGDLPQPLTETSGQLGSTVTDTITGYSTGLVNYTKDGNTAQPLNQFPDGLYKLHTNTDTTGYTDCITKYHADISGIPNGIYNGNIENLANSVCRDAGYTLFSKHLHWY